MQVHNYISQEYDGSTPIGVMIIDIPSSNRLGVELAVCSSQVSIYLLKLAPAPEGKAPFLCGHMCKSFKENVAINWDTPATYPSTMAF